MPSNHELSSIAAAFVLTIALHPAPARGEDGTLPPEPRPNVGVVQLGFYCVTRGVEIPKDVPFGIAVSTTPIPRKGKGNATVNDSTFLTNLFEQITQDYQRLIRQEESRQIQLRNGSQRVVVYAYLPGWDVDVVFAKQPELVAFSAREGEIAFECTGSCLRRQRERFGDADYFIVCEMDVNLERVRGEEDKVLVKVQLQPDSIFNRNRKLPASEASVELSIAELEQ